MRIARNVALVIAVLTGACGGEDKSPAAPTPAPVPTCQTNNTATATFENRFTTGTLDILLNGAKIVTIAPGTKSNPFTVAAGVMQTVVWQWTNTTAWACTPTTPVLTQCSSVTYYCPS
jgi:hypothetical protein